LLSNAGKAPHISILRRLEDEMDKQCVHEINPKTGKEFGYLRDRFPNSLVETYKALCFKADILFNRSIADRIWQIGMKAFDPSLYKKKGLIKGAKEVLNFLKEQDNELVLLTLGDRQVQQLKIDVLDLGQWFRHICIVLLNKDKEDVFRTTKRAFPKARSIYSVGNSMESDIKPALKIGLSAIHIPHNTWESNEEPESATKKLFQDRLFIFKEIIEIKKNYWKL